MLQPIAASAVSFLFKRAPLTRILAASLLASSLSLVSATAFAAKFRVVVLAPLTGTSSAQVSAMNDHDQVVGGVVEPKFGSLEAVIWNAGEPSLLYYAGPVGGALASGINDQGIVVGNADPDICPFVWGPTSGAICLYFGIGFAGGINDHGVIVGSVEGPDGGFPVPWPNPLGETGPLPDLGVTPGVANAISNSGIVVGFIETEDNSGDMHAARFAGSSYMDLGALGGRNSEAVAVNDRGFIAGWAEIGNGRVHAALWGPGTDAYDLGTLGGKQGFANGINAKGDVVGSAQTVTGAWHAVLWTHKHYKPVDLNVEISAADARAYTLISAVGTNDECRVIANGQDNKSGASLAFILYLTDQADCSSP